MPNQVQRQHALTAFLNSNGAPDPDSSGMQLKVRPHYGYLNLRGEPGDLRFMRAVQQNARAVPAHHSEYVYDRRSDNFLAGAGRMVIVYCPWEGKRNSGAAGKKPGRAVLFPGRCDRRPGHDTPARPPRPGSAGEGLYPGPAPGAPSRRACVPRRPWQRPPCSSPWPTMPQPSTSSSAAASPSTRPAGCARAAPRSIPVKTGSQWTRSRLMGDTVFDWTLTPAYTMRGQALVGVVRGWSVLLYPREGDNPVH